MTGSKTNAWRPPAGWIKSSFSNPNNNCVLVRRLPGGGIAIRDSKLQDDSPILQFTLGELVAFRAGLIAGEFDEVPH